MHKSEVHRIIEVPPQFGIPDFNFNLCREPVCQPPSTANLEISSHSPALTKQSYHQLVWVLLFNSSSIQFQHESRRSPSSISFPSVSVHMTIETDPLQSPLSQSSLAERAFNDLAAIMRLKNPSPGQSMSPPTRRLHRTMILAQ